MNFFISMMSEGEKVSHKRWISVSFAAFLCWGFSYGVIHAPTAVDRKDLIEAGMLFILIMSGVATVAQITSLIKGTPNDTTNKPEPKSE